MGRIKGGRNRSPQEKVIMLAKNSHPMRNSRWQHNHNIIRKVVMTHWVSNQSIPTHEELVELTGLSKATICRHWEDFDNTVMTELVQEQAALMVQPVLWGMYNAAMKGSTEAAKMLLKLGMEYTFDDDSQPQTVNNTLNVVNMNQEDVMNVEEKLKKFARRLERDKALGIAEGEVVDAPAANK